MRGRLRFARSRISRDFDRFRDRSYTRSMSDRGSGLGGLGAIAFLLVLGGVSVIAYRHSEPGGVDGERKPVSLEDEPRPSEPKHQRRRPWQSELDIRLATPVAVRPESSAKRGRAQAELRTGKPDARDHGDETSAGPEEVMVQILPGGDRVLYTLDPKMQATALEIFKGRSVPYAAAVALDLRDNSVLAFAAHSHMDPEVDPHEVLTTAWAPAASTFKLVTAAALLESKKVGPTTRVCFHGGLRGISDRMLIDDPKRDKRCESLSSAIAHSHNLVMAKLAHRHLSPSALGDVARRMGFASDIPFEFPVEPSPISIPTQPKEMAKVAAGFWHVDTSPLHAAVFTSVLARGGLYQPPTIVRQYLDHRGRDETPRIAPARRVLTQTVADRVGQMMIGTTTTGTARSSFRDPKSRKPFVPGVDVAGKTGSLTGRRAPALNYNWFVGFAPADKPEVAVAVLLANEPKWQIKAHYPARRLIQVYLSRRELIETRRRVRLDADGSALLAEQTAIPPILEPGLPGSAEEDAVAGKIQTAAIAGEPVDNPPTEAAAK